MKIQFLFLVLMIAAKQSYLQISPKVQNIDSIVSVIDKMQLNQKLDSTILNPGGKLISRVYSTTYYQDFGTLNKINWVSEFFITEKKGEKKVVNTNVLYYLNNKLIKAETVFIDGNKSPEYSSLYFDGSLIYPVSPSKKERDRSVEILNYSKQLADKFINQNND